MVEHRFTAAAPGSSRSTAISAEASSTISLTRGFRAPVVDQALGQILVARDGLADDPARAGKRLAPGRQPQLAVLDPDDEIVARPEVERLAYRRRR